MGSLPVPFPDGKAVGHGAVVRLALPSVKLEEGPDAPAHVASAPGLDLAARAVLEQPLHLGAVGRRALGQPALGRVQQQLHVQIDRALALHIHTSLSKRLSTEDMSIQT